MKYMIRLENGDEYGPADIALLREWANQRRVPKSAMLVPTDGTDPIPAIDLPELAGALQAITPPPTNAAHPPVEPTAPVQTNADSGVGVIIPYRNGPALAAYYLAVFSLIPFLGILLGVLAFVFGIIGVRLRSRNPEVHGIVHAWIGILGGGGLALLWIIILIVMITSIAIA